MKADNTEHLRLATRRRSDDARRRALDALTELHTAAAPITVTLLARHAHVARSWIYTQPDLLDAIQNSGRISSSPATPASDASWQSRIELAHARISELTEENKKLRHQLAVAHGQRRANAIASTSTTPSSTQKPRSAPTTTQ
ncbi:DUF6262 family protein [Williamsia sp. DF01-3]|uniref:DUF6262 family protein n=1 Tax=Williamsia sp. DF01-3 TaxID=2934157 RepID=UPI001FF5376D|nr:DUF6262 family protein [Williamsia sp. DF01-3]MCK0515858.1 DUF6262 family protein [Williamsia sp. DF01-3]